MQVCGNPCFHFAFKWAPRLGGNLFSRINSLAVPLSVLLTRSLLLPQGPFPNPQELLIMRFTNFFLSIISYSEKRRDKVFIIFGRLDPAWPVEPPPVNEARADCVLRIGSPILVFGTFSSGLLCCVGLLSIFYICFYPFFSSKPLSARFYTMLYSRVFTWLSKNDIFNRSELTNICHLYGRRQSKPSIAHTPHSLMKTLSHTPKPDCITRHMTQLFYRESPAPGLINSTDALSTRGQPYTDSTH